MLKYIKAKKFTLRPFRMNDAKSVALHVNDKLIIRYLSNLPFPYTEKDAKDWLKKKVSEYKQKKPSSVVFAIEIDGEAVGSVGLHSIAHEHKAEIGYWLGKKILGWGNNDRRSKRGNRIRLQKSWLASNKSRGVSAQ